MRTKALLLAAALTTAGIAAYAQSNVYSINVVGYINVSVPANTLGNGFAIIANQLQGTNNNIGSVIPPTSVPENTTVYYWNDQTSQFAIRSRGFDDNDNPAWSDTLDLSPGKGFWIKNPTATPVTVTFVGEVLQGPLANPLPAGFSMRASQVPQSGDLASVLQYPAVTGSTIYFWRNGNYVIRSRGFDDNDNPAWSDVTVPAVGEGFWAKEAAPLSWTRTFSVP